MDKPPLFRRGIAVAIIFLGDVDGGPILCHFRLVWKQVDLGIDHLQIVKRVRHFGHPGKDGCSAHNLA